MRGLALVDAAPAVCTPAGRAVEVRSGGEPLEVLPKIVAAVVAIIVIWPLAFYGSIFGAEIGFRFAVATGGTSREYIGFLAGRVLGCAASVFATGFLAIGSARMTGRLLSRMQRP